MENYENVLENIHIILNKLIHKKEFYQEETERLTTEEKQESEVFLSYVIMSGVTEDLEEFLRLAESDSKPRYQHFIIRNITEHVIEYMYLIANKELIPQYFGATADIDELEDDVDMKHISQEYKNLGQNRYAENRPSVNAMAVAIGEKKQKDGVPGLYDVFSIISENCHNSYFHAVIEEYTEDEMQNKVFSLYLISLVTMKLLEFENERVKQRRI